MSKQCNDAQQQALKQNRRSFLSRSGTGLGAIALYSLLQQDQNQIASAAQSGVLKTLHYPQKVKRIVHLCMAGGPSHLETFDDKPKLREMHGQAMPESFTKGQQIAQLQGRELKCFAPQFPFKKFGKSGQSVCDQFPKIGAMADELCIIRSMYTDQINHDPAHAVFNTGSSLAGRPSIGSWLLYGLGQETENLPGYVVLTSVGKGGQSQPIAARQWHSGFLPSQHQGVQFHASGSPVLYINRPDGVSLGQQKQLVDTVNGLNKKFNEVVDDPEISTRIKQYEMAFRMQTSVPELMDLAGETKETFESYGTKGGDGTYASNCLLARRLLEQGVRFVQLYHRAWDHHGGIKRAIEITAKEVDQATGAFLQDLKQRGLLDETLVLFGGEFGRTPMAQGSGRDHHIKGYSMFMAGGGIRGGSSYGNTDELGYAAQENPVHVRDIHATLLQQFGIDHRKLTYKFQGLDFRLTGVEEAKVLKDILV